ncbi:hypothetical protein I5G67_gp093 [Mycobacterium phage Aminay]|uniref:Uncharacterized protein n=1 Tax=Mycobacterium phage Aminay TaxID=2250291 RepID=A0A345KV77_9CAUD|nr:hypothetical protein I5G67_gp093 [Mycobacterium phage Aminay]AXH46929.1 hypothetical protein SEA_AMINAY_93 [Mycobacterium phage Aminay]
MAGTNFAQRVDTSTYSCSMVYMSNSEIKFKKQYKGLYFGKSDRHEFRIIKETYEGATYWLLDVKELVETAGIIHAIGQRVIAKTDNGTFGEAKRVAQRFAEKAGDVSEYGAQSVLHRASIEITEEDIAAIRATPEYQRAIAMLDSR